jgi:16S rRNA (cytidine1402-2'-O)-methyltransferase
MGELSMSKLYIVATPIGNLKDMTERAIETLQSVDWIAAEDTRHSKRLLEHFHLKARMRAYHDHNERKVSELLVAKMLAGETVALVSDAGTPLISDPGYRIVRLARESGIAVIPIPGACAMLAALSVAGLATDRFVFMGFLKKKARKKQLQSLLREPGTAIIYESPHRVSELMDDMLEVLGTDRTVVVARELTKRYEQVISGSVAEQSANLKNGTIPSKGEFVILIEGITVAYDEHRADEVLQLLLKEVAVSKAVMLAAKLTGVSKNELYQRALAIKDVS